MEMTARGPDPSWAPARRAAGRCPLRSRAWRRGCDVQARSTRPDVEPARRGTAIGLAGDDDTRGLYRTPVAGPSRGRHPHSGLAVRAHGGRAASRRVRRGHEPHAVQHQDVQGRRLWDRFWKVLREDDQLADRSYNVLEQFLDTTEDALEDGGLDEAGRRRAEKFKQQCEMSWKRIDRGRDRDGALGWAGEHATAHPPQSRRVIAALIGAIARHRAQVLREFGKPNAADAELWDVMAHLGLDPRDYETRDS